MLISVFSFSHCAISCNKPLFALSERISSLALFLREGIIYEAWWISYLTDPDTWRGSFIPFMKWSVDNCHRKVCHVWLQLLCPSKCLLVLIVWRYQSITRTSEKAKADLCHQTFSNSQPMACPEWLAKELWNLRKKALVLSISFPVYLTVLCTMKVINFFWVCSTN